MPDRRVQVDFRVIDVSTALYMAGVKFYMTGEKSDMIGVNR